MENKSKCLLVEPYELPKEIIIDNTLETKKILWWNIECAYLRNDNDVILICNMDSKNNGIKLNRDIGHDLITDPFLIVGDNYWNSEFKSLSDEQIIKYKMRVDKSSIIETKNKIKAILFNKNEKEMEMER